MAKTTMRATEKTPIEWKVAGRITQPNPTGLSRAITPRLVLDGDAIDIFIGGHAHSLADAKQRVVEATATYLTARDAVLNPPAANMVADPADPSGKDKVADPPGGRKAR